jgi:hypothetical protein
MAPGVFAGCWPFGLFRHIFGAPEPIRTVDLPLRRGTLYPAELRAHVFRPQHSKTAGSESHAFFAWWAVRDSNAGPLPSQGSDLSAGLTAHADILAEAQGFEPWRGFARLRAFQARPFSHLGKPPLVWSFLMESNHRLAPVKGAVSH